jgi:hypothetical protein
MPRKLLLPRLRRSAWDLPRRLVFELDWPDLNFNVCKHGGVRVWQHVVFDWLCAMLCVRQSLVRRGLFSLCKLLRQRGRSVLSLPSGLAIDRQRHELHGVRGWYMGASERRRLFKLHSKLLQLWRRGRLRELCRWRNLSVRLAGMRASGRTTGPGRHGFVPFRVAGRGRCRLCICRPGAANFFG